MTSSQWKILVVEDETDIRELLVEMLAQDGFDVISTCDGAEAIRLLADGTPVDLVITDINMPGADGYKVAEAARDNLPLVRLIFISGRHENELGSRGLYDAIFLRKPFSLRVFLSVVKNELHRPELLTFTAIRSITPSPMARAAA